MPVPHYAKRRDANEQAIVEALEAVGADVVKLDSADLLVGFRGQNFVLECKVPGGRLTRWQRKWWGRPWCGQRAIVRSPEEALEALGVRVE